MSCRLHTGMERHSRQESSKRHEQDKRLPFHSMSALLEGCLLLITWYLFFLIESWRKLTIFRLSTEKLRELWVIPLFFIIVTAVSMFVAWFLGVTFRLSRSQRCVSNCTLLSFFSLLLGVSRLLPQCSWIQILYLSRSCNLSWSLWMAWNGLQMIIMTRWLDER